MGGLTAEDALKAYLQKKKKSPYQLDLETKDRKPDIVPKVGDKVKIKSREWYEKWNNGFYVDVSGCFSPAMKAYCGEVLTVGKTYSRFFITKEDRREHYWSLEMFEEVYPKEELIDTPLKTPEASEVTSPKERLAKALTKYVLAKALTADPKLKQMKTTRLIKLNKV